MGYEKIAENPAELINKYLLENVGEKVIFSHLIQGRFSRESDSRIANVRLSVRQSVSLFQKPLSLSESSLSAIMPIGHYIYRLSDLLSRLLSHFGLFDLIQYDLIYFFPSLKSLRWWWWWWAVGIII